MGGGGRLPAADLQQGDAGVGPGGILACPRSSALSSHHFVSFFPATKSQPEETPQLMRTRSDVGVRRRGSARTPSEQRRIRRHRFSINGHFYNHKVSPEPRRLPKNLSRQIGGEIQAGGRFKWTLRPVDVRVHAGVRLRHQRPDKQHDDDPPGPQTAAQ